MKSFKRERELLLALLAALRDPDRATHLPADDPLLLPVARHHRLTPLLSATCGNSLPLPLRETARRDRIVTTARNMVLAQTGAEVIRALQASGIRTIVLKGLDYETRLYRVPGTRATADVDILIPGTQRRAAFAALDQLGFEPRAAAPGFDEPDYHEVAWARAGVEVDLHMALAPLARCKIDYEAVWGMAVPTRLADAEALALAPPHAAVFQALHMAIDHFDVPAIYLVDMQRLVPAEADVRVAEEFARRWRCHAPFATAMALVRSFVLGEGSTPSVKARLPRRIVDAYGGTHPLPRRVQLVRKVLHFDRMPDLARYAASQSRRKLRELFEQRLRRRTARERLAMGSLDRTVRPG